ncbi:MAG TPA: hypothetical protein VFA71_01540 [Terriglobales bacterium]|nr:hypothetical protein [Terriglobales bacterium]
MLGGVTYTVLMGLPPVPIPPPLLDALQKIEVETSTEMASVFRLRFGMARTDFGDWDVIMPQYEELFFRPMTPVQIRVKVGIEIPKAVINGYVTHQQVIYDDEGGASAMEISGMDATMVMNLQEKVVPWPMPNDGAIAAAIFGQYGIVPRVSPSLPFNLDPTDTTVQRGTDIRFLRRLAQRNGFECYVQPQPQTGIDFGYFGPPTNIPGMQEAVLNIKMGADTNVSEFKIRYDMMKPTTALSAGMDVMTRTPTFALSVTPPITPPPTGGLYPLGVPMGVQDATVRALAGAHPPPMVLPAQTGQMALPALTVVTQAIANRSSWAVVAEGTLGADVGVLLAGATVNIRGAGLAFNGAYYLTRVSHNFDCGAYTQKFEARRNAVGMTGTEIYVQV